MEDAGISGSDVSLINGHLTSTAADPLEVDNWLRALGLEPAAFPLIQSTKSMVGHGLGAAGALEAVAVVDQIAQGYVHPSINCEDVHREIRRVEGSIPHSQVERRLDHVVKASFGFGDVNGAVVFKRWDGDTARLTR
jgi:3-oxoacyl-(acyl-carrier-protein) synthase